MKQKGFLSGGLLLVALLFWLVPNLSIPYMDSAADRYFEDSIKKAGGTYAVARVINASVSVIKDSGLGIEPFGVGLNISVGQVVDPIDDMTERLSDVLVTAIVSLGVQKLVHELTAGLLPTVASILLLLGAIAVWVPQARSRRIPQRLARLLGFVLIVRLFLPASALVSDYIDIHFISPKVSAAENELKLASRDLDKFSDITLPEIDGLLGTLTNSKEFVAKKFDEFTAVLASLRKNLSTLIGNMLTLAWLYVAMLFVQVVALPLLAFYILVTLLNAVFNVKYPVVLGTPTKHASPSQPDAGGCPTIGST
ncbi:MAG: hypothetical protein JEZ11_06770 [Desulfobacterales bacterium]|nr:hypothetical protein [Desulfobacterales bacterium]